MISHWWASSSQREESVLSYKTSPIAPYGLKMFKFFQLLGILLATLLPMIVRNLFNIAVNSLEAT